VTLKTPCNDGSNNPDDWFIGRDGKQYGDDELVTEEEVAAHLAQVDPNGTRSEDEIQRVWDRMESIVKREALQRRRHAREACHDDCYFRLACLDLALKNGEIHGTWGGYHEEELRELRREISRRTRAREPRLLD